MNDNKVNAKELAAAIALPLAVGGLSALLTNNGMKEFAALRQPPLSPPGWVFPVVWTALYAMMGTASYKVYSSDVHDILRRRALRVYLSQLAVNFLWSIVFFALGAHLAALWLIVLLWLLIVVCMLMFYPISQKAGRLMIPYALWVSFAAYLNLGVYLLNR